MEQKWENFAKSKMRNEVRTWHLCFVSVMCLKLARDGSWKCVLKKHFKRDLSSTLHTMIVSLNSTAITKNLTKRMKKRS